MGPTHHGSCLWLHSMPLCPHLSIHISIHFIYSGWLCKPAVIIGLPGGFSSIMRGAPTQTTSALTYKIKAHSHHFFLTIYVFFSHYVCCVKSGSLPKSHNITYSVMNSGLPEMLHCLNSTSENSEMSVLERQRSRLKWQHPPNPLAYFNGNDNQLTYFSGDQGLCELVVNGAMKPDHDFLSLGNAADLQFTCALPRTVSCPPNVAAGKETTCKKRKANKIAAEDESKITEPNSKSNSTITTKGPSANAKKPADAPKTDYIHVRARRGQATDSHSLAERVRREKISERMKYLQDLVPGCNKVTGKAGMLDEIINYVQSLQRQVEFLSMKLAAINPRLDFDIDNYLLKEIFPTMGASSTGMVDHCHIPFNASVQGVSGSGLEMVVDPMDATLRRTISAPVTVPQTFLDSSNLNQVTWENELQNLYSMEYQQGRSASFISQQITDFLEANHVKLEM